jgi:phage tail protein X
MDLSRTATTEAMPPQRPLESPAMTSADKSTQAAQEDLRNLLAELQQVAESAIASSVDSTLNAAIREAGNTIDDLHCKKQPRRAAHVLGAAVHPTTCTDRSVTVTPASVDIAVCGLAATAALAASPGHYVANAAHHEFQAVAHPSQLRLRSSEQWAQSSRWTYVGVSTIVLLASVFVIFMAHLPHLLAAKPRAAEKTAYQADTKSAGSGKSLTIVVQPNQTIERLSSQYVGHFDYEVLQQIRALNPGLADPGHLEPGKALKLPLPRRVVNEVRKK